jgi:4-amino-4-deoxy-L-arabinose transferase-like glycosyltransferase
VSRPWLASSAPRFALARLVGLGLVVAIVLVVGAGGYGYHRDELYFLVSGSHLAWGYPDQGPLTPFIAHLANGVAPGSLTILRVPSALMIGVTVVITGALVFELGGSRRAQMIAASCMAVGAFPLFVGHLLSTSTFDLLAWTVATWLVARAVRTGQVWIWPAVGAIAGLALLNKPLIAFLFVALAAGILVAGPRDVLGRRWFWLGFGIAIALWSPWLVWQAGDGWPQLTVSSSIASGGSGSSQPRWALLPFQFLLISPVLSPVWVTGVVALLRRPSMYRFRFFAIAWFCLALIFFISGGKPYYLAGLFPVLLAAGAIEVDAWLERGSARTRKAGLGAALIVSGAVSVVLALPVLPARDTGVVLAANGDVGETIGWPELVRSVARVYHRAHGRRAVIFTSNYGEAGAIDRFGPTYRLPGAYSGHNGFGYWGPPPNRAGPVVTVGLGPEALARTFTRCRLAARVSNAAGAGNDEQGVAIDRCSGTRRPWSQIWKGLRHLD